MSFGQYVKHFRHVRDWSQDRLANEINKSRSAVATWDSGQSVPDFAVGCETARALDCQPSDLYDGPGQFALNVVALRNAQRITAATMANMLRMPLATLEDIERGSLIPSEDGPLTAAFAKQFACSPDVLFGDIDICEVSA